MKIPALKKDIRYRAYSPSGSSSSSHETDTGTSLLPSASDSSHDDLLSLTTNETWLSEPTSLWAMTMNTPQDRLLELKLMHHFTTMSSDTLFRLLGSRKFQTAQTRNAYARWVTDLAMRTPELMDALLGFAAFNLRQLQPVDKEDSELSYASHKYMTQAITAHSQQLRQGISDQNAEILFAGGSLIAFIAVSSHEYLSPEDDDLLPLHWFRPWQGVRAIVKASWDLLHTEELRSLLESERETSLLAELSTDGSSKRFDFLLDDLDRSVTDPDIVLAYERAVHFLSTILANPDQDYCFKFAAKVSPEFVKMLVDNDPRTLTIVGYFFMALKVSEQEWWLPRPTGREFNSLMRLLPEEWKPRMALAAKVFEDCVG